jgi:hypothetical protein
MNPADRHIEDTVDSLVLAHLDRLARQVDPEPGLARIERTLGRPRAGRSRPSFRRSLANRWTLGSAIAASLLVLTIGAFYLPARPASAESIVRQAKAAQASPLDRCYRVETDLEIEFADDDQPTIARPRRTRLWTRGDRFWIESDIGLRHLNWGRDESGGLWLAYAPHRGLRFDPADIPPAVALRCDVLSVRLETLLSEVLMNFDLKTDPENASIIRASPKPGHRRILREAVLEIDPSTKVLKRLELTRSLAGRTITTRFHLEETRDLDDSQYELEGHLESPYQINQHDFDPQRRRQIMLRLFGIRPGEGLPAGNPR